MEILKTEEAADYLRVKKSCLEAWRCRGGGPAYVKFGGAVRYKKHDLDSFIEKNRYNNTSSRRLGIV